MDNRRTVAVLDLWDGPEAAAGASVLAALDCARFRRVGLVLRGREAGARRNGALDATAMLPALKDAAFLEALLEALQRAGAGVLLPGSIEAAFAVARWRTSLARAGVAIPPAACETLALLAEHGILEACCRASLPVGKLADLSREPGALRAQGLHWPLLLLGAAGERRRAGDAWEALRGVEPLAARGRVCFAPFDPARLFEAALVLDERRGVLGASAVRVLADDERVRPWLAVTVENETLLAAASRLGVALGLLGPAHFLFQQEGAAFHALDAQPGFPLWIEATAAAGPHLVEIAVCQALGEEAAPAIAATPAGVLFSQTAEDFAFDPELSLTSDPGRKT
ncbi:MAG: hypothetical protein HY812_07220 [Planctomycetes bacterium]|nr:hypothetical protein [Planctomycetota bacterium]